MNEWKNIFVWEIPLRSFNDMRDMHIADILFFYYFSKHKKAFFWNWSDAMNGKHLFVVYFQMYVCVCIAMDEP